MSSIEGVKRRTPDVEKNKEVNGSQTNQTKPVYSQDKVTLSTQTATQSSSASLLLSLSNGVSSVRVAYETADKLEKVVRSLKGIVDQAEKDPQTRKKEILEKEGTSLLEAVGEIIEAEAPDGTKPLKGDPIRIRAEKELSESLELLLPKVTKEAIGLDSFSLKDSIMSIRAKIDKALEVVGSIKEAVTESDNKLRAFALNQEVARENKAASQSTLKDVDDALAASESLAESIVDKGKEAFAAAGLRRDLSARLLN